MIDWIKNNTTLTIAIYGAVLSTIALIWNIYNSSQDKPKIKIKTKFGFFSSSTGSEGPFLFIIAINKGKRSVYLSSFGLRTGNEDLIPNRITGIPCELKGGTSHDEFFKINELKNREFDFAWYRDATGKIYKSKSINKKLNNYFKSKKTKKELEE
ncbi:MAG: hypothetical protein AABY22_18120 [Nanoarchaeota archaeon]